MKWLWTGMYEFGAPEYRCENCGYTSSDVNRAYLFCPNCGKRLNFEDSDDEEDEE